MDADFIIAGAGIGGLTAALALARIGCTVVILEKRAALDDRGAGIQITPNASRVLIALGLGGALGDVARAPSRLEIRRFGDLRDTVELPLDLIASRHGAPYWTLMRADLQNALRTALAAEQRVTLRLDAALTGIEQQADSVTVTARAADGTAFRLAARALIGADGLWSETRQAAGQAGPPRFTGYEAWRGLADVSAAPDFLKQPIVGLWLGAGAHLVHYRAGAGGALNVVLVRAAASLREGWSNAADKSAIGPLTALMAKPLAQLLDTVPQWQAWSLYDRPAAPMAHGRVALLGDAAHPILPFLAQGAALAIEDAAVLAHHIGQFGLDGAPQAFKAYHRARYRRAARLRRSSRLNGWTYHLAGFKAALRDTVMRTAGGERLAKRYDWLYRWQPPGEGIR